MVRRTQTTRATQHAAVLHGPHDLRVEQRAVPPPGQNQALVRVRAAGICGSDLAYLNGVSKYSVNEPFVLGHEASGVVAALGQADQGRVPTLSTGDRVALAPGFSCGTCRLCRAGLDNLCQSVRYLGSAAAEPPVDGAIQEYICLPLKQLVPVPDSISDSAAALLEPLAVAEHATRRGQVAGSTVLIVGGGVIGQLLALTTRAADAASITVCETQQRRRELALAHGADAVADSAQIEQRVASGVSYDVVFDATGNPAALDMCIRAATPSRGRLVVVGNLPSGTGLSAEAIQRAEIWVTSTFRFPRGLDRALALVSSGLDVDWLVEQEVGLDGLSEAMSVATGIDPPLKIQITPRPNLLHMDHARTDQN